MLLSLFGNYVLVEFLLAFVVNLLSHCFLLLACVSWCRLEHTVTPFGFVVFRSLSVGQSYKAIAALHRATGCNKQAIGSQLLKKRELVQEDAHGLAV